MKSDGTVELAGGLEPCSHLTDSCHCPLLTPDPLGLAATVLPQSTDQVSLAEGGPNSTITFHPGRSLGRRAQGWAYVPRHHGWEGRQVCPSLAHSMCYSSGTSFHHHSGIKNALDGGCTLSGGPICHGLEWWAHDETNLFAPTQGPAF